MKGTNRSSSLYQPFLDEDEVNREEEGSGVVLFHRRSWHPWDLLSGQVVTITTHAIRVEASSAMMCCGSKRTKSSLPLADVRDLALQPGCLGTLWPTIFVYSRHDPHHPALRLRTLRGAFPHLARLPSCMKDLRFLRLVVPAGATEVFKALREAVSEVHSRELMGHDL
jgi:hypothetical protein